MWPVVSAGRKMPAVMMMESRAAVSEGNLVEHGADTGAVGDVAGEADGRAAIRRTPLPATPIPRPY